MRLARPSRLRSPRPDWARKPRASALPAPELRLSAAGAFPPSRREAAFAVVAAEQQRAFQAVAQRRRASAAAPRRPLPALAPLSVARVSPALRAAQSVQARSF